LSTNTSILERFQIQDGKMALWTVLYSLLGVIVYVTLSLIPMPYLMVSLFKLGLLPALAVIGVVGAIRGPIAGFITGYLGEVVYGLVSHGVVVAMTLPALAYGVMGFVVGLASYDLANGRSLAKLSVLSLVGYVFTVLLVIVVGIVVTDYSIMAALAFQLLPLLTLGIPTVILLTPVFARTWHLFVGRFLPSALPPQQV
jgi:energy-coupling factor transport system substrate-specific component